MNANLRVGVFSLAALFVGGGLGACTSSATPGGTGGSGGAGATTTGTAGTTAAGAASGGGSSGNGVACNAANNTTNLAPSPGIACPPPAASGLITNFSVSPDAGVPDGGLTQVHFGDDSTTLSGGESTYANSPGTITSNVTSGDWEIKGTVANYAGFSLYFDDVPNPAGSTNYCNMVDATGFSGIQFTIWGTTSMQNITMSMGIVDDTPPPSWFQSIGVTEGTMPVPAGSCIPNANGMQYYHPGCGDPTAAPFSVTGSSTAPQTITFKWTDFMSGACMPNVIPSQIVTMAWQFAWSTSATPYTVDIHIGNITFIK